MKRAKPPPKTIRSDPMLPNADFMSLVGSFYEACVEPEKWAGTVEAMAEHFGYNTAGLLWGNHVTMNPFYVIWHNFDDRFQRDYVGHWGQRNAFVDHPRRPPLGHVYTTWDMVTVDEWKKLEYTNEFLIPNKIETSLGVDLFKTPSITGVLEFQRTLRQGRATQKERQYLAHLVPHLQRACEITWRLWQADAIRSDFLAALETVADAVALIDERGRIAHMNSLALNLLESPKGLAFREGRLRALLPEEDARLQRVIADAIDTARGSGVGGGGKVRVSGPDAQESLRITVSSILPQRSEIEFPVARICAALFIRDTGATPPDAAGALRMLYGLTGAEARVALGLAEGLSLAELAERQSLRVSTLRNQLKAVFSKTNARRQAELVRLVLKAI